MSTLDSIPSPAIFRTVALNLYRLTPSAGPSHPTRTYESLSSATFCDPRARQLRRIPPLASSSNLSANSVPNA